MIDSYNTLIHPTHILHSYHIHTLHTHTQVRAQKSPRALIGAHRDTVIIVAKDPLMDMVRGLQV
jgi:hypothetical protein